MIIRKLRQKKIVSRYTFFSFLLLGGVVYILITGILGVVQRFTKTPQEEMVYTLGATLTFSGVIVADNKFPHYTHSLTTFEGNKIGLKSSTINLNAYTGKVIELVGRVKKYYKIIPILEVDTLKFPNQGLILNMNRYFFVNDLLYLDFSTQPQLTAIKSGEDIQVLFNQDSIVSIERFVCSKILKTRDCTYLIGNYIQANKDTFESYWAYTFYKHTTGVWTTFDNNDYGFLFKNVSDDVILDISNMFRIVNKQFVLENKMQLIQTYCKNDVTELYKIHEGTFQYQDPYLITLILHGIDKKKHPVICKITFDVWNDWQVTEVEFRKE